MDLVVEADGRILAVEAKSGATVASGFFEGLRDFGEGVGDGSPEKLELRLVFGGETDHSRSDVEVIAWHGIHDWEWV